MLNNTAKSESNITLSNVLATSIPECSGTFSAPGACFSQALVSFRRCFPCNQLDLPGAGLIDFGERNS